MQQVFAQGTAIMVPRTSDSRHSTTHLQAQLQLRCCIPRCCTGRLPSITQVLRQAACSCRAQQLGPGLLQPGCWGAQAMEWGKGQLKGPQQVGVGGRQLGLRLLLAAGG